MSRDWRRVLIALFLVVGCAVAPTVAPTPRFGAAIQVEARDAEFLVTFDLDRPEWHAGEAISGISRLERLGSGLTISGSGGGPFGFAFAEVSGTRHVEPIWTADCTSHPLAPTEQVTSPITKSGGVAREDPDFGFWSAFFDTPGVSLATGTWDISAVAWFSDGSDCAGPQHRITATARVTIVP